MNELIEPQFIKEIEYVSKECSPIIKKYDDDIQNGIFSCFSDKYNIIAGNESFVGHIFSGSSGFPNYTIDKTKIIELISLKPLVSNYFVAPKRFGKTFTATMICTFYDYYYKNVFDVIFKDTYIKTSYPDGYGNVSPLRFHSQYFVFTLSFKSFTVLGKKDYEENFVLILKKYFAEFSEKYFGKDMTRMFVSQKLSKYNSCEQKILFFFHELIDFCNSTLHIKNGCGIQLLIFIDECQDAYCGVLNNESNINLFSGFLTSITKGFITSSTRKRPILFMVGLLPLPSRIIISNLESIITHRITSPLMSFFVGFFSKDVEKMFQDFNLSKEAKDLLRKYLNSYTFCDFRQLSTYRFVSPTEIESDYSLCNPWSLMMSLQNGKLLLLYTSGQTLFQTVYYSLSKQFGDFSEILFRLINGNIIDFNAKPNLKLEELINPANNHLFLELLLHSGFLSYKEGTVFIPDKEIHLFFIEQFSEYTTVNNIPSKITNSLEQYFSEKKFYEFFLCFQEAIREQFSSDNDHNERYFQYSLCIWLMSSLPNHIVKADYPIEHFDNSRTAFADLVIISNDGVAIVIEIKIGGDTNDSFLKEAFRGYHQIFSSRYTDIHRHVKIDSVLISSMSIHGNDSCFIFTDLVPKEDFSSSKFIDFNHYIIPPLSKRPKNNDKIRWIEFDNQDIEKLINEYKDFSSIFFVESIQEIQYVHSLENWPRITGFIDQNNRETMINQNDEIRKVMTFVALRGVYIPPVKISFVLNPPFDKKILSVIGTLTEDRIILLHKDYDEQKIREITEFLLYLN